MNGATGPTGATGPAGTFSGTFTGDVTFQGNVVASGSITAGAGESAANPAASCSALHAARATLSNGVYWLKPTSAPQAFRAYCDMAGGGWTLVWSNLRGGKAKPPTDLTWMAAITTTPRYSNEPTANLESFSVYTGLQHFKPLAPAGLIRYDWSPDYGAGVIRSNSAPFRLDTTLNYAISFGTVTVLVNASAANPISDFFGYHNGRQFSTIDAPHDGNSTPCSSSYSNTPFWYGACWSGSIWGDGELNSAGRNAAHWIYSTVAGGSATDATGNGLGWMYVR